MKLTYTDEFDELVEINLPAGLLWEDEFKWTNAVGTQDYSLSGALIQQAGTRLKGRPITLVAPDAEMAWISRPDLVVLQAEANVADRKYTLVIGSGPSERQFPVRFRHDELALEATPVYRWQGTGNETWYTITLRLLEVAS